MSAARAGREGTCQVSVPRLSAFDARDNGITAARLGLALMVVVSHSVSLGGWGPEPLLAQDHGRASLGFIAVIGFFALSGFLLTGSRERTPVPIFLRNRALRILPGYWLALAFAMLVAVPLCAVIRGVPLDAGAGAAWIQPRLLFLGGPEDGPFSAAIGGGLVNGSLWTLGVEVLCYLLLAATPRRWLRPFVIASLVLLGLWQVQSGLAGPATTLMLAFALGSAAWLWRAWIPMSGLTAVAGAVAGATALWLGAYEVAIVLLSYAALGLSLLPLRFERDLSYGVYVFAYPLQKLLVVAGVAAFGLPVMIGASIGIVLPLALLSWTLVERPAIRLKSWRLPRLSVRAEAPVPVPAEWAPAHH